MALDGQAPYVATITDARAALSGLNGAALEMDHGSHDVRKRLRRGDSAACVPELLLEQRQHESVKFLHGHIWAVPRCAWAGYAVAAASLPSLPNPSSVPQGRAATPATCVSSFCRRAITSLRGRSKHACGDAVFMSHAAHDMRASCIRRDPALCAAVAHLCHCPRGSVLARDACTGVPLLRKERPCRGGESAEGLQAEMRGEG